MRRQCESEYVFALTANVPHIDKSITANPFVHALNEQAYKLRNMVFYGHTALKLPADLHPIQELYERDIARSPIAPKDIGDLLMLIEEDDVHLLTDLHKNVMVQVLNESPCLCMMGSFDLERRLARSMRRLLNCGRLVTIARHALDYQSAEWEAVRVWSESVTSPHFHMMQVSRGEKRLRLLSSLTGVSARSITPPHTKIPDSCSHLIVSDAHRLTFHGWNRVVSWTEEREDRRVIACGSYSTTAPGSGSVFIDVTEKSHSELSPDEMALFGTRVVRSSSSAKEAIECFQRVRAESPHGWKWCFLVRVKPRFRELRKQAFSEDCVLVDNLVDGVEYDAVLLDCSVTLREKRLAIELVVATAETSSPTRLYNMVCMKETRAQKNASLREQHRITTFGMLFKRAIKS